LYGYHRLSIESEIVVMRAAGLSRVGLAGPGLMLAVMVMLASYLCTLYLMPLGLRELRDLRTEWRASLASFVLQEGVFNSLRQGLTVYIRRRESNGNLLGILVHDSRDREQPVTYMAEQGAFRFNEDGPRFTMVNGNRQEVDRENGGLRLLYFERYTMDLSGFAKTTRAQWREPDERYLHELFWPDDRGASERQRWELRMEGHRRLTVPLFAIGFAMIALAGVLTGEFNRRAVALRIIVACACGFAFATGGLGLVQASVKVPWLLPLVYINLFVAIVGGGYILLRGAPRRRLAAPAPAPVAGE
jgi:lipopolysaccharide export system permease protein